MRVMQRNTRQPFRLTSHDEGTVQAELPEFILAAFISEPVTQE